MSVVCFHHNKILLCKIGDGNEINFKIVNRMTVK